MSEEKTIRSFLAIELPEEILHKIADIQMRLKKNLPGVISWVRPEGIHLTLKFFGNISGDDVVNISRVVENSVAPVKPLSLSIKDVGVFPDVVRPRVVWLGINGDVAPLSNLQKAMDRGFQEYGFKREERPFRPHLTLGRIKSSKGMSGLAAILEGGGDYSAGQFQAKELTLFQSDLTPRGAIYTKLAQFPFRG
ncbi:MAG: RNA 2',3'-cyclic phosphodiesterase [Syntrophales bacterium]|nr:RNA 2',3'-cyclic phosphodiesterase [Syntrophales bacterium]